MNLTPLLDVTFQLIIFFILVTNFAAANLPRIDVPSPEDSAAEPQVDASRIIVNVIPRPGTSQADYLVVQGRPMGLYQLDRLAARLAEQVEHQPDLEVNLRADESIAYADIHPVMQAIARSGVVRVNLVALTDQP
jgi:biopolymer transport protein ExbD